MIMERKKCNFLFAVLLAASIGSSLLQTSLATALPAIMRDLSITVSSAQWLTSGYSLAMGVMVPATAFFMKRFPTRSLFFCASVTFLTGTFLSFIAGNFPILFLSRMLQAIGNGILLPMTQVVILTVYPVEKRGAVMGIYGLAAGAAPVIAPALAGIIIDLWNWRTIFLIVFCIILIDILLALKAMQNVTTAEKISFDSPSMLLCGLGFSVLLIGAGNIGSMKLLSIGLLLFIGAIALFLFVRRQLKLEQPFLELRILQNRDYRLAVIVSMLLYAVMMAGSTLFPIYIQTIMGKSATVSGLIMMPGSLVMAVISPLTGKFYDRFGIRKLAVFGSLMMLLSCLGVTSVGAETPVPYIALMYILRLIAIGCLMMPMVTWGMSGLAPEHTSHGTALLTSLRTISGAFGAAISVAVMSMAAGTVSSESAAAARGIDAAFICVALLAAVQMIVAAAWVGKKTRRPISI